MYAYILGRYNLSERSAAVITLLHRMASITVIWATCIYVYSISVCKVTIQETLLSCVIIMIDGQ